MSPQENVKLTSSYYFKVIFSLQNLYALSLRSCSPQSYCLTLYWLPANILATQFYIKRAVFKSECCLFLIKLLAEPKALLEFRIELSLAERVLMTLGC